MSVHCLICSAELPKGRRKFCCHQHAMKWHNDRQVWLERPDRELHNARKRADPEKNAAKARTWRAKNPLRQKELERANRLRNKEAIASQHALWRETNLDYVREKGRERHAQNRELANAGRRARRLANLDYERLQQRASFQTTRIISPWLLLLAAAKERAKKYNIPFDLTEAWAINRWTGCCELTDIPFRLGARGNGPKTFSPSIDQIVARKGYTQNNCRFVLWAVNALKHDGTDEDMYLVAAALMDKKFSFEINSLERTSIQVVAPEPRG